MAAAETTAVRAVASGHPEAAQVGLEALAAGGSAVDAALAMAFTQWVVNGPLCGPGGDLFLMYADGDDVTVFGGWSRVPLGFPVEGPITASGPTAAVVPGALAGAHAAWRAAGRLSWQELLVPAIARSSGHAVTPWMAKSYASVVDRGHGAALAAFLEQPNPPAAGDSVACRPLGRTLERIAEHGALELYDGQLGQELVKAAAEAGGYLSTEDLAAVQAAETPASVHTFPDLTVAVPGAPSQGGIVPRLVAAAPADADPGSDAFAEATANVIERELTDRCVVGVPGTAASVATDGVGVAAVVHSLAGVQFGSGWVAGDSGVAFGNRVGTSLSTRADLPAANPQPGAVLPHTLSAALLRDGDRTMMVATPGGDRQVQWLAQSAQRFRLGADAPAVATGPRWFVCPEGDRFGVPGGIGQEWFMFAEPGIEWSNRDRVAGYAVRRMESVGGGLQVAACTRGRWTVASDPRSGGAALVEGGADV
ncbi:MAG TPA: gamma-glutamyltransferase [Mycobacteriales bacterium]|nr:gamma-glutamyltransferase [Mycobacteriales bacterium]